MKGGRGKYSHCQRENPLERSKKTGRRKKREWVKKPKGGVTFPSPKSGHKRKCSRNGVELSIGSRMSHEKERKKRGMRSALEPRWR